MTSIQILTYTRSEHEGLAARPCKNTSGTYWPQSVKACWEYLPEGHRLVLRSYEMLGPKIKKDGTASTNRTSELVWGVFSGGDHDPEVESRYLAQSGVEIRDILLADRQTVLQTLADAGDVSGVK